MNIFLPLFGVLAVAPAIGQGNQTWFTSDVNGHDYLLDTSGMSWTAGEALAVSLGGHLATVRSVQEHDWIRQQVFPLSGGNLFIGFNDVAVEGQWVWSSGEPVTYTNWFGGFPDNCCGGQDAARIMSCCSNGWDDVTADATIYSVLIEFTGITDCNGNGVEDGDDIAGGASSDCDGDGVPDECQIAEFPALDCNGNGILDSCELVDCDGDGALDSCQITADPSLDQNVNGILDACECSMETYCIAAANSTGQPAAMGASGTASLNANNLTLSVSSAPPFQFGLFFYGANEDFAIFGDGALCVSAPFARVLPVIATDGTGSASVLLNLYDDPFTVSPNIVAPFETWRFQFWYRDPLGGPAGFNLSDGIAVTFCP